MCPGCFSCRCHLTCTNLSLSYLLLFYSGRKIQAQIIPENTYHLKFPGALAAHTPLKLQYLYCACFVSHVNTLFLSVSCRKVCLHMFSPILVTNSIFNFDVCSEHAHASWTYILLLFYISVLALFLYKFCGSVSVI